MMRLSETKAKHSTETLARVEDCGVGTFYPSSEEVRCFFFKGYIKSLLVFFGLVRAF